MPSMLTYSEQGFWISNSTEDLLLEILLAMTRDDHSDIHERFETNEALLASQGISGSGEA